MSDTFPSIAFQSSLGTGALLFGVFGFLYSVYAMYSSIANKEQEARSRIVYDMRFLCRILSVLILLNLIVTGVSLWLMPINGVLNWFLAGTFVLMEVVTTGISFWIAFRAME